MEMIPIPAGAAIIGTGSRQIDRLRAQTEWAEAWFQKGFFSREQPQHTVDLEAFSIGKYPLTVGAYRHFWEAGGYLERRYWTDSGWLWRKTHHIRRPLFWEDPLWTQYDRLPVVGVSWFEAFAFCQWYSELTGERYTLPSEAQWEKAARGADDRLYPWGNTTHPRRCNTRAGGIGHTVPVGSYHPLGDSPHGCGDMVGNVSEWTLNRFSPYPYLSNDGREEPEGTAARATRGGSWHSPGARARVSSRGMNDPFFRDNDLGFRVVRLD